MANNSREYNRNYARVRRFLYRLQHPPKQRGPRRGWKKVREIAKINMYNWDRTLRGDEDWSRD